MPLQAMPYLEWRAMALQGKAPADDILLYKDCTLPHIKMLDDGLRQVRIRISNADVDRENDTIAVGGWDTSHYEKNPVVLFAHSYGRLPVGKAVELHRDEMGLSAVDQFVPPEIDAFAETVYQMLKHGFLNTASVGFRPLGHTINEERRGVDFLRQELLEHSIVPVPANPAALVEARSALGAEVMQPLILWCEQTLDTWQKAQASPVDKSQVEEAHNVLTPIQSVNGFVADKGMAPRDVSRRTAPQDTEWSRPTASDFTEEAFDTLSAGARRRIAGHFAWTEEQPPTAYQQLKLPHHRSEDGQVVWRGVTAAMAALLGARGGVNIPDADRREVYDHLASHYQQFDAEPPGFRFVQAEVLKHLAEDYRFDLETGGLTFESPTEHTAIAPARETAETLDAFNAWVERALPAPAADPDPLAEILPSLQAQLPDLIREAVQTELMSITGRLPD